MLPSDGARKKPELSTGEKKNRDREIQREEKKRAARTRGDLTPPENAFPGR